MYRSTAPLFTSKLPFYINSANVVAMVNFMGKMSTNISPSLISSIFITILITENQMLYVCVGLHLLSSKRLLFLIFGNYGCHSNLFITLALCNSEILSSFKKILHGFICYFMNYYCCSKIVTTSKID